METKGKREETLVQHSVFQIGANRAVTAKVCLRCNRQVHQCPTPRMSHGMARKAFSDNDIVIFSVIAKGTLINIAEQVMVVNEAIFMHKVDETVVLKSPHLF